MASAIGDAQPGEIIVLAPGNYGTVTFPASQAASGITILGGAGVNVDKVYFYSLNNEHSRCPVNLTLKGLNFTGYGVEVNNTNTNGLSIVDCTFAAGSIIRLVGENTDLTVSGCTFAGGPMSDDVNTIWATKINGATIEGNEFNNADYNAVSFNHSSGFVDGTVKILDNTVNGSEDRAFRFKNLTSTANLIVSGNVVVSEGDEGGSLAKVDGMTGGATATVSGNTWNGMTDAQAIDAGKITGFSI